ncbi:type II toxin-antitoxin system RelE/ParE family toxin [Mucilaginibacter sp.]|uniref:type II toxin-antitoxin system RelE/ParE family toxin n=1 Tax=Mucilaginibacter sp. TaxID=1882438 RepID=UPI0038CDA354
MAAKVVWSVRAQRERFEILEYWINRNKSKTYSRKLYQLFRIGMKKVAEMPEAGIPTENPDVRFKIIKDYIVYYHISSSKTIEVLTVWDSRRNPRKFKLK